MLGPSPSQAEQTGEIFAARILMRESCIKTIIDLYGTVTGASYTDNTLSNVENAIMIHSDYSKSEGEYTGDATSKVEITDITISGLSGTADDIYDILANPDVVSGWTFSDNTVTGDTGSCSGEPSGVGC